MLCLGDAQGLCKAQKERCKIHTKTEKQYVGYVYSTQAMLSLISFPNPPLYKQGCWISVLIAYCDTSEIKSTDFLPALSVNLVALVLYQILLVFLGLRKH